MSERKHYHKAVRDRIPASLDKKGIRHESRQAPPAEFARLLDAKLDEEVAEYHASKDPAELADILEVCFALAKRAGVSEGDLLEMRERKRRDRGAFEDAWVLEWTDG